MDRSRATRARVPWGRGRVRGPPQPPADPRGQPLGVARQAGPYQLPDEQPGRSTVAGRLTVGPGLSPQWRLAKVFSG